jgi:hypothetical protein
MGVCAGNSEWPAERMYRGASRTRMGGPRVLSSSRLALEDIGKVPRATARRHPCRSCGGSANHEDSAVGAGSDRVPSGEPHLARTLLLPGTINHHWTKSLLASPDGSKLYVGVGSNSNVTENGSAVEYRRADVLEPSALIGRACCGPSAARGHPDRASSRFASIGSTAAEPRSKRFSGPLAVCAVEQTRRSAGRILRG